MKRPSTIDRPIAAGLFLGLLIVFSLAATPVKDLVLQGNMNAGGYAITNVSAGTNASNAATIGYVTNQIATAATNYVQNSDQPVTIDSPAPVTIALNGGVSLGGQLTTAGILTTDGDVSITGAHSLQMRLAGATDVTLPTSGTLATVAGTVAASSGTASALTLSSPASGDSTIGPRMTAMRASFSNASVTVSAGTSYLGQTGTMSASRTVTLPAASAVPAGYQLVIADESGTVTNTNTIVLQRAGSDTINGATTETMSTAYAHRRLISNGVDAWLFDAGVVRIGAASQTLAGNLLINGNTTVGDSSADTLTINSGTLAAPNASGTGSTAIANVGTLDALYGRTYTLRIASDLSGASTTPTESSESVVLPAGTYDYWAWLYVVSSSTTSGVQADAFVVSGTFTARQGISQRASNTSQDAVVLTLAEDLRAVNGAGTTVGAILGDAPSRTAAGWSRGQVTLAATGTIRLRSYQRTTTDGANPAILRAGSHAVFRRVQ